jgi:hypothetical protein
MTRFGPVSTCQQSFQRVCGGPDVGNDCVTKYGAEQNCCAAAPEAMRRNASARLTAMNST